MAKKTKVSFSENSFNLKTDEQDITIQLASTISVTGSNHFPFTQKIELKLLKSEQGFNWLNLTPSTGSVGNATPVSTAIEPPKQTAPYASKKNWDKIDQELKKDMDAEKPEGDAALNGLFK